MTSLRPVFIFSMMPRYATSFKDFFESTRLRSALETPGQIRPSGWDLNTHGRAQIVKGEYLEVKSAERKRIQVYEDGSIFARVPGDQEFLGWGVNDETFNAMPRLNTLSLVEFTLNFCNLCSALIKFMQTDHLTLNSLLRLRMPSLTHPSSFLFPSRYQALGGFSPTTGTMLPNPPQSADLLFLPKNLNHGQTSLPFCFYARYSFGSAWCPT